MVEVRVKLPGARYGCVALLGLVAWALCACGSTTHPTPAVVVTVPSSAPTMVDDCARYGPWATVVRVQMQTNQQVAGKAAPTVVVAGIEYPDEKSLLEHGDTLMLDPFVDLNGDDVIDAQLFRLVRSGEGDWGLDCRYWGECVAGAYVRCATNGFVEMVPADYYAQIEASSTATTHRGATYRDIILVEQAELSGLRPVLWRFSGDRYQRSQ